MTSRLLAGWSFALGLIWLCWVLMAPIVAEHNYRPPVSQHLCPMIKVTHGIGPDLKTYTRAVDRCATGL